MRADIQSARCRSSLQISEWAHSRRFGHASKTSFDIPAESLADARYAYISAPAVEALAAAELLADLRSADWATTKPCRTPHKGVVASGKSQ
jgi:hypothetical protein